MVKRCYSNLVTKGAIKMFCLIIFSCSIRVVCACASLMQMVQSQSCEFFLKRKRRILAALFIISPAWSCLDFHIAVDSV